MKPRGFAEEVTSRGQGSGKGRAGLGRGRRVGPGTLHLGLFIESLSHASCTPHPPIWAADHLLPSPPHSGAGAIWKQKPKDARRRLQLCSLPPTCCPPPDRCPQRLVKAEKLEAGGKFGGR